MTQGTDIPSSIAAPYGYVQTIIKNSSMYGTNALKPLATTVLDTTYYFETDTETLWQAQHGVWMQVGVGNPVGSCYITAVNINPNVLLGYGTWTQIGSGKILVGG